HDELVFDIYKPELEEMKAMIKTEMEGAFKMDVPLDVEMDTGLNWLEAH
ncbi:DNA polymerase, partial [uncultured Winogradskyella sp.]